MDARRKTTTPNDPRVAESKQAPAQPPRSASHRELVWEHRLLWLLMLAILGLWGYHYVMGRVDRTLRGEVLKILTAKFPKHRIQLDRAHLEKGQAILLEGLQIAVPTSEGWRDVLRIQRVVASGKIELLQLVSGEIPIQHVCIDGLEISAWPITPEFWSLQTLASDSPLPAKLPSIEVRTGLLRVGRESQADGEVICHDLKGQLQAHREETGGTQLNASNPLVFQGSVSSSVFKQLQISGWLKKDKTQWSIQGQLSDFEFSDRLLELVPAVWQEQLLAANGLRCRGKAKFECSQQGSGIHYDVRGDIYQGRLEHPKLPYLLENLRGDFYCRNGLLQFRRVLATNGDATLSAEADIEGLPSHSNALIRMRIGDLALNTKLFQALPEAGRNVWNKLQIGGNVDAEIELKYHDRQWIPDVTVHCRDVSLVPDVFPYPLQHLRGDIRYRAGVVEGNGLQASAGGQALFGSIRLERWQARWLLDLELASDGAVPIDPTLIAALTVRGQVPSNLEMFARSLKPSGLVSLKNAKFRRTKEAPDYLSKSLELQFYSGAILYNNFRYPIFDIQGNVVVADDVILLKEFEGRHDAARINCYGRYAITPSKASDLSLNFDVSSVPLQDGLRRALPPQVQELWNQAQPSGVLDEVKVLVTRTPEHPELDVRVDIVENGPVDSQTAQTVSLRPPSLPYLLNDISCKLSYRPGTLDLHLKGFHDSSVVLTDGNCRLQEDGSWRCWLSWLPQTRVLVDRSLLSALPEKLRKPLETLEFRGPVNVGGWTLFVADPKSGNPYAQSYDLALDIEDGKLSGGSVASGIRGTIGLQGVFAENAPIAVGKFQLDAMTVKEIPVTNLQGHFAMDGENIYFGRDASAIQLPASMAQYLQSVASPSNQVQLASGIERTTLPGLPKANGTITGSPSPPSTASAGLAMEVHPDDLQAKMLSGQLRVHGNAHLATGRVNVQVQLHDADFRSLLLDLGQSAGRASGRLFAEMSVSGAPHNLNTLTGEGTVRLRDADLYELPSMVRLFRLLSVRPPDDGAFESADIRFTIDGDRIPLQEFALDGDLISLRGTGWVNTRRELQLNLDTYVGRRGQIAQLIGPILSGNDSATLLRIEVFGTTDNVQMRRHFPGIETGLEQVMPDRLGRNR